MNTNKYLELRANARKWKHEEWGVIKAATGTELPFIGLHRQINLAAASESEKEYQEKVKKFLSETEFEVPKLNIPEEQHVETKQTTTPAKKTDWTAGYRIGEGTSNNTTQNDSTSTKQYSVKTKNENRKKLRAILKARGLDDDTTEALLVQAGAESGYNHQIKNPTSSAYGLGQWIAANHKPVLDYINQKNGTNYTDLSQLNFDDQAEALAWWYYDRNKDLIDKQQGSYNKVKALAKIGLAPAIVSQGQYTWNKTGKTYRDTDEDWLQWFTDTGHNPNGKITSFDQHIADRYRHAGYA